MSKRRRCNCCKQIFLITRNPGQRYCSQPDCQRARKNQWRKHIRRDQDYRINQRYANKRWRRLHPDYWQRYRTSHQDYVCRNREQQHIRNCRAKILVKAQAVNIAKSDALNTSKPVDSGDCWLIPVPTDNIAKSDALFVRIAVITRDSGQIAVL